MDDSRIRLLPHELELAASVGLRRQLSAIQAGRADRHGLDPENGWGVHVEGACGELAVAKFLGRYWEGSVDTFRTKPDLGEKIEIKTRSRHSYELLIRPDDDPGKVFVLVTGRAPSFWIRGWLRGLDARRDEWWKSHGGREPAWFVPHKDLQTEWPGRRFS